MSDELRILWLGAPFQDEALLAKLHEIQMQRVTERRITAGARPEGARLSIADPVRRVKAIFDPFWRVPVAETIGERGYLMEDLLEVALFHADDAPLKGYAYQSQVPIPWGPIVDEFFGTRLWKSAFDWMDASGAVTSCKSKDGKGCRIDKLKPSSDNIAQERRMLALYGAEAGTVWETWMVDPGTLQAIGPYVNELDQGNIDAALKEAEAVEAAWAFFKASEDPTKHPFWNDPEAWRKQWNLRSTSAAFQLERLDANGGIERRVWRFAKAMRELKEAKREYESQKDLIQPYVEEQITLARAAGIKTSKVSAHSEPIDFAIRSNGAFVPTERSVEEPEAVAS